MPPIYLLFAAVLLLQACTAVSDPAARERIGAVGGAVIDNQIKNKNGGLVGGAIGAGLGAFLGGDLNKAQAELNIALTDDEIEAERINEKTVLVTIPGDKLFNGKDSVINPDARVMLDRIGAILERHYNTSVRIVAHTDSLGSSESNKEVTERQATAITEYFVSRTGLDPERLTTIGAGETQPVTLDSTETRTLNRRLEIFLKQES